MPPKKQIEYKARILFLHGFAQSSSVFYAKTSALRKKLQSLQYKSIYLNAPVNLTPAQLPSSDSLSKFNTVVSTEEEETNYRGWWTRKPDGTYEVEDAIETVRDYINNNLIIVGSPEDEKANNTSDSDLELPIAGIIGFSQGAAFAGALVHTFDELFGVEPLEFAVLYSGFKIDTRIMPQYKKLYSERDGEDTKARLLHVVGELDTVVGDDRGYTMYDDTKKNLHLLKHPGGHFVPNSKLLIDQVTNWMAGKNEVEVKEKPKDDVADLLAMIDKLGG
ncbi:CIC11C00000000241 [Sungouiella intermedia]|uniref:CIC11C00000000241 n=1 Tax=Sungouiella intermedia TaxID=45354 RepID=A0A1L0BQ59_9ASCO|nr:CIC11C00000000241 [[Candida] intermedia]